MYNYHNHMACQAKIAIPRCYFIISIINNDHHQLQKRYQQTTGLIQRLICNTHILSIGVILAEKFCLRKCICFSSQVSLGWITISRQTEKGNGITHGHIWQDNCVELTKLHDIVHITYVNFTVCNITKAHCNSHIKKISPNFNI